MALSVTPSLQEQKRAQPIAGRIQQESFILSKEDLVASKRAAGRDVDLKDVLLLELPEDEDAER